MRKVPIAVFIPLKLGSFMQLNSLISYPSTVEKREQKKKGEERELLLNREAMIQTTRKT